MIDEKKYKMTQEGLIQMKEELNNLTSVERGKNLEALKEAREHGDLSENADYDAARDEQARIESRIKELELILKNVEIIKETKGNKVQLGKQVTIKYLTEEENESYTIVGPLEADPLSGKISNESPVGKAIIGKKIGDKALFKTEKNKDLEVEIINIK